MRAKDELPPSYEIATGQVSIPVTVPETSPPKYETGELPSVVVLEENHATNNVPVNSSSNNFSINNPPSFLGCSFKSWILVFLTFDVLFLLVLMRSFNHPQVLM